MTVQRDTLYFDGACGMCRRSTAILHRLDWLGNLASVDMTAVPPADLPVAPETAMAGLPMRTADGRVLVGFPAVRRALSRTPLGAPAAWVLWIPGVSHVGQAVYGWVARNRSRDACSLDSGSGTDDPSPI
ncbi:MAG: DUF393 domain-containing protein [Planctomycetota bacterium]